MMRNNRIFQWIARAFAISSMLIAPLATWGITLNTCSIAEALFQHPVHAERFVWYAPYCQVPASDWEQFVNLLNMRKTLTSVLIHNHYLDDSSASYLAQAQHLTELSVRYAELTDTGLADLLQMPTLRALDVTGNRIRGQQTLTISNQLEALNLSYNRLYASTAEFWEAFPRTLRLLSIAHNGIGNMARLAKYPTSSELEVLNTSGNPFGNSLAHWLYWHAPKLQELIANYGQWTANGLRQLHSLSHLRALALRSQQLGDQAAIVLAQQGNLLRLDLADNHLTAQGATVLAQQGNLRHLNLAYNNIGDAGIAAFAHSRLRSLNAANNGLGPAAAQALAGNTSLESLLLGHNHIGASGLLALSRSAIPVVELDVSDNGIGGTPETVQAIAALSEHRSFAFLGLAHNSLTDADIGVLFSGKIAEPTNWALYVLNQLLGVPNPVSWWDLRANQIQQEGVRLAFSRRHHVHSLLSGNPGFQPGIMDSGWDNIFSVYWHQVLHPASAQAPNTLGNHFSPAAP